MFKGEYNIITLIPVLKEEENIAPIIKKIEKLNLDLAIVFVVTTLSNKKDKTLKEVKKHSHKNNNIFWIQNKTQGLGLAYKQGINYVSNNFAFNYLCTMDADESHTPKNIQKLISNARQADLTLGSRYLEKSKVSWSSIRYNGSKIVNFLCRIFTGIKVRDHTTGFRIYKKEIVDKIDLDKVKARGFVFQAEMLSHVYKNNGIIHEIPIDFKDRKRGTSKFRTIDKLEYIKVIGPCIFKTILKKIKLVLKSLIWLFKLGWKITINRILFAFGVFRKNPFRIMLKINNFCNYQCQTCKIWQNNQKNILSPEKQRNIIDKYRNNIFFLTITGGEPFLAPKELNSLLERFLKDCPYLKYISLNTNCSQPKKTRAIINKFLQRNPTLHIYLGLHYIPSQEWGERKTGIKNSYNNYLKTLKEIKYLRKRYGNRFKVYKMITISNPKDIDYIKKEKDLWLNFVEVNEFYNNTSVSGLNQLTKEDKLKAIKKFRKLNKKNLSFLNKKYFSNLKNIILEDERKRNCYAGINRLYFNADGEEFICSRGLKEKQPNYCKKCWTACEANFDMVQDFFLNL